MDDMQGFRVVLLPERPAASQEKREKEDKGGYISYLHMGCFI
jgi:hypothetical protein